MVVRVLVYDTWPDIKHIWAISQDSCKLLSHIKNTHLKSIQVYYNTHCRVMGIFYDTISVKCVIIKCAHFAIFSYLSNYQKIVKLHFKVWINKNGILSHEDSMCLNTFL